MYNRTVSLKTDFKEIINANAPCLNTWLCRHSVGISGILLNYGQLLTLSALLVFLTAMLIVFLLLLLVLLFAACHCLVAYFVASDAMLPSGWCTVIFVYCVGGGGYGVCMFTNMSVCIFSCYMLWRMYNRDAREKFPCETSQYLCSEGFFSRLLYNNTS